jgi:PAS domain S-box-containing protein
MNITSALVGAPLELHTGHFVRFFDDDSFLLDEVVEFIDGALRAGGLGIVIATAEHLTALTRRLSGFQLATAYSKWYPGQLLALDADETLSQFMVADWPDADRFERSVGRIIADAAATGATPVHAFGEMVAVLCAQEKFDAALRLEELWNELAAKHGFHLFCAYPSRLFSGSEHVPAFERICRAHSHVCCSERLAHVKAPRDVHRLVASWEHKALALDAEVARRKAAEATLRQRELELSDFLENAAEGLHKVAGDGTILWANRAELDLLGYSHEEYVGRHIAEFHVDGPVIESILSTLAAGSTLQDQPARLRCKDGSIKHVLIHSNGCFENGELVYTRCFTRDATDRVARQQAQDQLRDTLMNAPVATALLVGPQHMFRLANRRFCDMVGRDDLAGQPFASALPDWDSDEIRRQLHRVLATGESFTAEEIRIDHQVDESEREERYFKFNLEPCRSADGTVEGVIAVIVDLTEQVRARQAMERSFVEREHLLLQLREASRAKDEFLAMLGHELRNPLSPIVTALQLMRMRGDTGTEREQAIIQRQVQHLVRLVDDLLDIAKITRGKIELKKEWVSLSDVLTKAVEMSSPLLEQRSHRLSVDLPAGLHLHADAVRVAQVVSNLLTNAARYTAIGGNILLRARQLEGAVVEICVEDNGMGISAELLPKVFDIFFQGTRTVSRSEGGLGIGLALVKSLVHLHRGTVCAFSEGPGRGSSFVIRLPIAAADAQPRVPPGMRPAPENSSMSPGDFRILLVDDNVDAVDTLAHLLRSGGYDVRVAHDPAAAFECVQRFVPDLAILDIGLPVMDGYELLEQLRKRAALDACCFVALTGYGQDTDRHRSRAAGFHKHLVKPIDPAFLLDFVRAKAAQRQRQDDAG